jgi:amino acid transporter
LINSICDSALVLAFALALVQTVVPLFGARAGNHKMMAVGGPVAVTGFALTALSFAALATALGLGWVAVLLYTDAIVSPGGTGLIYTGASARLTFALARNGFIPSAFARLSPRGTPFLAIAFSFLCGLVILLPFPGWQQLVGFIAAAAVAVYAMAPLALGALRRQDPERPRPFRLAAASLLAPATFVAASEILLFTGWAVVWKLIAAILIGGVVCCAAAIGGGSEGDDRQRRRV